MTDNTNPQPHKPSKSWLTVWLATTALGVGSWVLLAVLTYYRGSAPISFGDTVLISFLTLVPVLGAVAVGTWVIRNAQYQIEQRRDREDDRRHTELITRIDTLAEDNRQAVWQTVADTLRDSPTPLRPHSNRH